MFKTYLLTESIASWNVAVR